MDAAIVSAGLQPAPQRPVEHDRVQPAAPVQAGPDPAAPSVASPSADRLSAQRSVDLDAATGSLVYRLVDLSSGIVTFQTPTDARLKLRAYIDGVLSSGAEPSVEVRA